MTDDNMNDVQALKDFEHRGWDKAAGGYTDTFTLLTSEAVPALLKDGEFKPGKKVLDVAWGPGLVATAAHAADADATGLDLSNEMLASAQTNHPGTEYRSGDAEYLPFEDGECDAVISKLGLYHFPRPDKALAEAFRVLKKGGRVAFADWCAPIENPGFALLLEAIRAHGTLDVPLPPARRHFDSRIRWSVPRP